MGFIAEPIQPHRGTPCSQHPQASAIRIHFAGVTPVLEEMLHFHDAVRGRASNSLREKVLRWVVPRGMAVRLSRPVTRLVAPLQRVRATKALRRCARLHLGSGPNPLQGWVNVDLLGWSVDVAWDLSRPLPFPDESTDEVFTEHLLEHLPFVDAARMLKEAQRVLRPGGVLRVVVPDAGRYLRSYATADGWIDELRPAAASPLLAVADVLYRHGHVSAWDGQTLTALLMELGFADVGEARFGQSRIAPCPDLASRAAESLYVEAVR